MPISTCHPCSRNSVSTLIYYFFLYPPVPSQGRCPTFSPGGAAHLAGADTRQSPGREFDSPKGGHIYNWSWEIIRKRRGCRFLPTWRGWFLLFLLRTVCKCACFHDSQILFLCSSPSCYAYSIFRTALLSVAARPFVPRRAFSPGLTIAFSFSGFL